MAENAWQMRGFGTISQSGLTDLRDKTERDVRTAFGLLALMECTKEKKCLWRNLRVEIARVF